MSRVGRCHCALALLLLAASTFVACGVGDVPDCKSDAVREALASYLTDPTVRPLAATIGPVSLLGRARFEVEALRDQHVDTSLKSATCTCTVHTRVEDRLFTDELNFTDHLTGDRLHVIQADLSGIDAHLWQ